MEASRDGYSGLYTLHFSNLFPPDANVTNNVSNKNANKGSAASANKTSSSSSSFFSSSSSSSPEASSLTQFTNWHVLLRMSVENEMWFVQTEAKVFSPTPSLASPSARGRRRNNEPVINVTLPDGIPIVPIHQKDRKCVVVNEMSDTFGWSDETESNENTTCTNNNNNNNSSSSNTNNSNSNTKTNAINKSKRPSSLVSLSSFTSSSPISPEYSLRLQIHFDRFERELLGLGKDFVIDDGSDDTGTSSSFPITTTTTAAAANNIITTDNNNTNDSSNSNNKSNNNSNINSNKSKKSEELKDVTLICNAHKECGWHMGEVSVKVHNNEITLPQPLRFILKPYYGVRCTYCADPVYAVGFTCEQCEMTNYCSRECMQNHLRSNSGGGSNSTTTVGTSVSSNNNSSNSCSNNTIANANINNISHGWLCNKLKDKYGVHGGRVVSEIKTEYVLNAWWRGGEHGMFYILVDGRAPFPYPMEFTLSLLEDAAEAGIQYRLIVKDEDYAAICSNLNNSASSNDKCTTATTNNNATTNTTTATSTANISRGSKHIPAEETIVELFSLLLREVNRCAILDGCITLSSACLNYLSHFSSLPSELVLYSHILFFTAFHLEEFIGPVTTIEEYVCYSRPLHSLALLEIETALQATVSAEFWRRIKIAKDVLVALLTINTNRPCETNAAMQLVIMRQQCETFTLLSNVYVMIATRAPKEDAMKWLEQAEKCLRQCCKNTNLRHDIPLHAKMYFRLSVLLLLFDDKLKQKESITLRKLGEAMLSPEWNEEISSSNATNKKKGKETAGVAVTTAAVNSISKSVSVSAKTNTINKNSNETNNNNTTTTASTDEAKMQKEQPHQQQQQQQQQQQKKKTKNKNNKTSVRVK